MPPTLSPIDIATFEGGDHATKHRIAVEIARMCEQTGFLIISGNGIAPDLLARGFQLTRAFFAQPDADKRRWKAPSHVRARGYYESESRGLGRVIYGKEGPADLRETLFLGPTDERPPPFVHIPEAGAHYAPNIYPDQPEGLQATTIEIYRAFEALMGRMFHILAFALGLPEAFFQSKLDKHFSHLAFNYYAPFDTPPKPGQLRVGPHTDFGALTLLASTPGTGGLEVQRPDGTWLAVQPAAGELAVNLGDMMGRWTNDRWVSTLHRVSNPPALRDPGSERQTIIYFTNPNYDAEVRCIPSCLRPGEAPKYPPMTAGEHIRAKVERSYT